MQSVRSLSELVDRPRRERIEPYLQLTQKRRGDSSARRTPEASEREVRFGSDDEGTSAFPILNMQNMYTTPVITRTRTPVVPRSSVRSAKEYFFQADEDIWF